MNHVARFITIAALISALPAAQLYAQAMSEKHEAIEEDGNAAHKGSCQGAPGPIGNRGEQGPRGARGAAGVAAYAEYVSMDNSANTGMSADQAFTLPTLIIASPGFHAALNPHTAHDGTTFTFPTGRYVLNYEVSVDPNGSSPYNGATIAVYMGNVNAGSLTMQEKSLAGNKPGGDNGNVAWVHGRHIIEVTAEQGRQDVYIGTVIGTDNVNVSVAATNDTRIVRLIIVRLT